MPSALRQYAALVVLFAAAVFMQTGNTGRLIQLLRHGDSLPAEPFTLSPATRTIATGPFRGDELLAIEGHPFSSVSQYAKAVEAKRPGETVKFTLSEPGGRATERDIAIPSAVLPGVRQIAVAVALNLLIPFVGLALGFGVVLIRPKDWRAWLVLFLMTGFSETVQTFNRAGPHPDVTFLWNSFWKTVWPVSMMYFGIYFPSRSARDKRRPWIKHVALAIFLPMP